MLDKKSLRKKYSELRQMLELDDIEELSLQIANQALKLPIWNKTYYHIFLSIANKKEINTDYLMHILQGKDKSIVVARADFNTSELIHFLLQENTTIKLSEYGIPEPVSGIELPSDMMEVVFVPLLAFDYDGNRIGYGKGFYDRFLSECKENTLFIGLSFFPPEEEEIPYEDMDVPLHFCITPKRIYSF